MALGHLQPGVENGQVDGGSGLADAASFHVHGLAVEVARRGHKAPVGDKGTAVVGVGELLPGHEHPAVGKLGRQAHIGPAAGAAVGVGGGLPQHVPEQQLGEGLGGDLRLGQDQRHPAVSALPGLRKAPAGPFHVQILSGDRGDDLPGLRVIVGVRNRCVDLLPDSLQVGLGGGHGGDQGLHWGYAASLAVEHPVGLLLQRGQEGGHIQAPACTAFGKHDLGISESIGSLGVAVTPVLHGLEHRLGHGPQGDGDLLAAAPQKGADQLAAPQKEAAGLFPLQMLHRLGGMDGKGLPGYGIDLLFTDELHRHVGEPGAHALLQPLLRLAPAHAGQVHPGGAGVGQRPIFGIGVGADPQINRQKQRGQDTACRGYLSLLLVGRRQTLAPGSFLMLRGRGLLSLYIGRFSHLIQIFLVHGPHLLIAPIYSSSSSSLSPLYILKR